MSQPYVGEIRLFGCNFAPAGWAVCGGQLLAISDYETLFNLIGTTYGGDGQATFAVPDYRGRVPIHQGSGPGLSTYQMGETGGAESITLTSTQIPSHTHALVASTASGTVNSPAGALLAQTGAIKPYQNDAASANMNAAAVTSVGGSQPHSNIQPVLAVNFCISLYGIYPSPT